MKQLIEAIEALNDIRKYGTETIYREQITADSALVCIIDNPDFAENIIDKKLAQQLQNLAVELKIINHCVNNDDLEEYCESLGVPELPDEIEDYCMIVEPTIIGIRDRAFVIGQRADDMENDDSTTFSEIVRR